MNHPENPFWAAMLSNPTDNLPRLVFCDWLEENGEVDRAIDLRYTNGFNRVGAGIGAGVGAGIGTGVGAGIGAGIGGVSAGIGAVGVSAGIGGGCGGGGGVDAGVGVGGGVGGGVGVGDGAGIGAGVIYFFIGTFAMKNGYYLVYFSTGYYPLVQVGYVTIEGAELHLHGSRVVANSGIGADWARLAYDGPATATLQPVAKHTVIVPRQCIVHPLNIEKWEKALPEAIKAAEKDFLESR